MSASARQSRSRKFMILAGEPSGDLQAALLLRHLRHLRPEWSFFGMGGRLMVEEGFEQLVGIDDLGVVGFAGVARKLGLFRRVFSQMVAALRERRPEGVILVDYPGFNLRFAGEAKKRGGDVVYYIAPQMWAWGEGRIEKLRDCVDLLIAIFPFEQEYFHSRGVRVCRVGHPLVDIVRPARDKRKFRANLGLAENARLVALLPGSRPDEVERHLPIMLETMSILDRSMGPVAPIIARAPGIDAPMVRAMCAQVGYADPLITEDTYSALAASDAAIVKSGTGTVECALLGTPFVVMYKTGRINYLIARRLIKTPFVGMVNLVAGKAVAPEFIQGNAAADRLAEALGALLQHGPYRDMMVAELGRVRERLGPPGGARDAAQIVVDWFERMKHGEQGRLDAID